MGNKIQLALIIVVTILIMTQVYTVVELVRLNSNDHGTTKDCYEHKYKSFSWKHKYSGKMKSFDVKK